MNWKSYDVLLSAENTKPVSKMGAIILILQLLVSFGFSESSKDLTRAEPNLDLECLNDYLTEMVCRLTPDQLHSCSEYSLNVSRENDNALFECDFKLNFNTCECLLQVQSGFVVGEKFRVTVLRSKSQLFVENVSTTESIKPKKPAIVSVNQTPNGNYLIAWDTGYRTQQQTFSTELIPELLYYVDGSSESRKIERLPKGQADYELIGRNLESNSNYIVKARVRSDLNSRFSDYSDPYRFTTPSSPKQVLKIIIPVICIVVIISILTMYYFYSKILTEWWEKVPTPKIATSFVKQVPNLLSLQNEFSPVHLVSSKLVHAGEKTWPACSPVNERGENSLNSLVKDGNSADVIYGQTGNESLEETITGNTTHWELVKDPRSTNTHQIPMSSKYKNLDPNSDVETECENSSGISNKFYMLSFSDKFLDPAFRNVHSESESLFPALPRNPKPTVVTDFEYSPCPGTRTGSENVSPFHHLTPSSNDIIMVPGYQSVSEVSCTPTDQAFISSHNDFNLIMDKLIGSRNTQNVSSEASIIPVENGYKDFQSLLQNS